MTAAFDPVVHPEPRLRICSFLLPAEDVTFGAVRDALGYSDSMLSKHLRTLADAGYVVLTKESDVPRPRTWVSLSTEGRSAFLGHLAALRELAGDGQPSA